MSLGLDVDDLDLMEIFESCSHLRFNQRVRVYILMVGNIGTGETALALLYIDVRL